jgi:hypothetical protein
MVFLLQHFQAILWFTPLKIYILMKHQICHRLMAIREPQWILRVRVLAEVLFFIIAYCLGSGSMILRPRQAVAASAKGKLVPLIVFAAALSKPIEKSPNSKSLHRKRGRDTQDSEQEHPRKEVHIENEDSVQKPMEAREVESRKEDYLKKFNALVRFNEVFRAELEKQLVEAKVNLNRDLDKVEIYMLEQKILHELHQQPELVKDLGSMLKRAKA